jgi:hypothetical protein
MKYSEFFDKRKNTFEKSYELILENMKRKKEGEIYTIVELGSSRSFVNYCFEGCCVPDKKYWCPDEPSRWDWGAGVFTKVFSDNLTGYPFVLYTIDPDENAHQIVTVICDGHPNVVIEKNYSNPFLRSMKGKIDFLYMDHMEIYLNHIESNEATCLQHLEDCKTIIDLDLMSENGVILIDDVGDNIYSSKGKYSIPYLLENGFVAILNEYQVLLVRKG